MRLAARDGSSTEIALLAYEQDEPAVGEDEWLLVRVAVTAGEESWTVEEPMLTTGEVGQLASWLAAIGRGEDVDPELDFLEPTLRFDLLGGDEPAATLRVWLLRAPGEELWLDLVVERAELAAAAESLRVELETFPTRLAWDEG